MGSSNKFRERDFNYKKTPEKFRKYGESTHGEGRHKAHHKGERITYATPKGREGGTVIEAHKEFYIVRSGNDIIKVNRNSILYSLGTFVGGARQMVDNAKKAYEFGKQKENERLAKYKAQYGKKKISVPKPKPKPRKK